MTILCGKDLVYYQTDLIKELVAPRVLQEAQRLLPKDSEVWAAGKLFDLINCVDY